MFDAKEGVRVFRLKGSKTYVVLGRLGQSVDWMSQLQNENRGAGAAALSQAAQDAGDGAAAAAAAAAGAAPAPGVGGPKVVAVPDDEDDEELDAGDLDEAMITQVMERAGASRNGAVRALQEADGDVVEACMALKG